MESEDIRLHTRTSSQYAMWTKTCVSGGTKPPSEHESSSVPAPNDVGQCCASKTSGDSVLTGRCQPVIQLSTVLDEIRKLQSLPKSPTSVMKSTDVRLCL